MSDTTKDAVPSELHEAARQFHNLTQGDPSVIIRAPSAEKRDAIIAAGERLRAALAQVQAEAATDTQRLDFMLANDAFTVKCNRDGSILQYQLMTQDEDENYHVLHDENRFYNTEREAIDAAISAPSTGDQS